MRTSGVDSSTIYYPYARYPGHVRIAELSRRSGTTIPTIKYYLREALLPPGTPTGRNQAEYDDHHLSRLRLIQALREVGGLSVAATREVIEALDDPDCSGHGLMGRAHQAVIRQPVATGANPDDPARHHARAEATQVVTDLGWRIHVDGPVLDRLADVLLALRRVGRTDLIDALPRYADLALALAEQEVPAARAAGDPAAVMTSVVTGTVLGETLLTTLRLLAHEHVSATLAGSEADCCGNPDSEVDCCGSTDDTDDP
jgi:DNA-binding transcriptional MerR regulator